MKNTWYILLCTVIMHMYSADRSVHAQFSLEEVLVHELQDSSIAKEIAAIMIDHVLKWTAPTIPPQEINTIVAYAFGNRILSNGNRLPGPVNELLADIAVQLYRETNAFVYAQWEVHEAIGDRIPTEKIRSINPTLDARANVIYLSTADVACAILKIVNNHPNKLGKVAVIAFNDHAYYCTKISRDAGMNAYCPAGYIMPCEYDKESGQPWTRDRLTYLVHSIQHRIQNYLNLNTRNTIFME